jgi:DNA-binding NtrC family response regulator
MSRMLVIDDQPLIRDVFREALENDWHHVTVTVDGYEGVKSYRNVGPDLGMMDPQMPGLDGVRDHPTVANRGRRPDHRHERSRRMGPRREQAGDRVTPWRVRTFEKPIRLHDLVILVREVLSHFGVRQATPASRHDA